MIQELFIFCINSWTFENHPRFSYWLLIKQWLKKKSRNHWKIIKQSLICFKYKKWIFHNFNKKKLKNKRGPSKEIQKRAFLVIGQNLIAKCRCSLDNFYLENLLVTTTNKKIII